MPHGNDNGKRTPEPTREKSGEPEQKKKKENWKSYGGRGHKDHKLAGRRRGKGSAIRRKPTTSGKKKTSTRPSPTQGPSSAETEGGTISEERTRLLQGPDVARHGEKRKKTIGTKKENPNAGKGTSFPETKGKGSRQDHARKKGDRRSDLREGNINKVALKKNFVRGFR